ncbi:family 16 glycosylhydrolase [Marinibacterium sp. SX1]|uniref:family 16 glycosylhydrolase n=1 Tax=Marinibacterium sp. SX1 TaxID=3388424 RepID=UPI003D16376A
MSLFNAARMIAFHASIFHFLSLAGPALAQGGVPDEDVIGFIEKFDDKDWRDKWYISNFDRNDGFATSWRRRLAVVHWPAAPEIGDGFARLSLESAPEGQVTPYLGAELQRQGPFGYGRYEVYMKPGRGDGLVSAFFVYTGPAFDKPHDEIDFEFLGRDTTKVWLNIFTNGDNLPGRWLDLGFDAANAPHLYRFDWRADSVTWYVDGQEILTVTSEEHPIPQTPGKVFLHIWAGTDKMVDWLKAPAADLAAQADYYCASYRPFGAEGENCADYIGENDG